MKRLSFITCGVLIAFSSLFAAANEITIETNKDVGFFDIGPNQNMGLNGHVPVGGANNGRINHSIFNFPILDFLAEGVTIDTVTFQFDVSQQGGNQGSSPAVFDLHRVMRNWDEGTGQSSGGMQTMDGATWLNATANELWDTPGGDFDPVVSGSVLVSGAGTYTISSPQMTADVQAMVDGIVPNHGFLMKGANFVPGSAARVLSREYGIPATLTISFTPVDVLLGDINRDGSIDLLDVAPFVNLLTEGICQAEADINGDGVVDLLDVQPFVTLLVGN